MKRAVTQAAAPDAPGWLPAVSTGPAAITFADVERMAESIARSGLFAMKTPEQALALMLVSQANGEHPARACVEYHIIQGKPAMTSAAMLARFQQQGGKLRWLQRTDEVAEAEFSHPSGGTLRVKWSIGDARKIGLVGKENWRNYPRAMLSARVVSEGVRAILPGAILGFYDPDEVVDSSQVEIVEVEPSAPAKRSLFGPARSDTPATADGEAFADNPRVAMSELAALVAPDGEVASAILRTKGWLAEGQTWQDLPPDRVSEILRAPARFRAAVAAAKMEATR